MPAGTPGFIVEPAYDKLGWHASDTHGADLRATAGCPRTTCSASAGSGFKQFLKTLDDGRIAIAALAVGCAQACLELATDYAKTRIAFGRPDRASTRASPSRSPTSPSWSRAPRLLTYKAAWLKDELHAGKRSVKEVKQAAAIAKLYSTEAAVTATRIATQVFGGNGFMEEYPVARFYRDAKILEIGEGTSEVQRMLIAAASACPAPDAGSGPARPTAAGVHSGPDQPRATPSRRPPVRRRAVDPRVADVRADCRGARASARAGEGAGQARRPGQALRPRPDRPAVRRGLASSRTAATPTPLPPGLPADGVVTGRGTVDGRPAIVIANDPTVKAGSWGARTVEKIVRATETALREELPVFWLVDSAGARITDQVEMFPGRRGAGRIFHNQVRALGQGAADLLPVRAVAPPAAPTSPAFCDIVIMVEGNASMYLGSPRMAEMVIGEKATLEEMGGARMHCTVSGVRRPARARRRRGHRAGQALLLLPARGSWRDRPADVRRRGASHAADPRRRCPSASAVPFDIHDVIDGLVDDDCFFELKPLFAAELVVGFGRLDGQTVGIVANNSMVKGGVLFTDSADKAARFIWLCDAFNVPLVFLADVPGLHDRLRGRARRHHPPRRQDGHARSRRRPCRSSASSCARPTAPGSTPWAARASGPTRPSRCRPPGSPSWAPRPPSTRSTPTRSPRSPTRTSGHASSPTDAGEYEEDVDLERLAADLVLDSIIEADELRSDLVRRLAYASRRDRHFSERRRAVPPV